MNPDGAGSDETGEQGSIGRTLPPLVWIVAVAVFALLASVRVGVWHPTAEVMLDGQTRAIPNGFASVDHPFHASRAETLLRTLREGGILRWVDDHQGGYPVEFYPLGAAWLDIAVWAASLGTLPMAAAHSVAAVAVLVLPVIGFATLARRDRMPLAVAVLALVAHAVVPGGWYGGGYTELVQWGLVTNVTAGAVLFLAYAWTLGWVADGSRLALVGAALAGGFALCTNPRSFVAFGAAGLGILAARCLPGSSGPPLSRVIVRLAVAAGLMLLLAAPEVVSLARFSRYYTFVQYSGYAGFADWLRASVESVTVPVFALGLVGVAIGLANPRFTALRATGATWLLYAGLTLLFVEGSPLRRVVPQLEATRLMPFQRLLTIMLAAAAVWVLLSWAARHLRPGDRRLAEALVGGVAVLVALFWLRPGLPGTPDPAVPTPPARGLYPVAMSGVPLQADLQTAVQVADARAAPGTALLILGSDLSWHQQLWAPFWTERPLYYDNWLWYWHPYHAGTPGYRPDLGNHYPDPARTLDPSYLRQHGIGAVVATGPVAAEAASDPGLTPVRDGVYGAWLVRSPVGVVSVGESTLDTTLGNGRVTAIGESGGGEAVVRQNWFPRWRATVNGAPVAVGRTPDNQISLPVPPGRVTISLVYGVDPLDWLARGASLVGVVGLALVTLVGRRSRQAQASVPGVSSGPTR